jgi:2-oxoisovalerate dehydrogenase E2 component (dihydrolipoyl transacylase)
MAIPVKMPQLGESVVEGTVARWLKAPGDRVEKLEPLLDISTDKIDTEVPAPAAGTLLSIEVAEGQTVNAGTVLAYIGNAGEEVKRATPDASSTQESPVDRPVEKSTPTATPTTQERPTGREFISPVVARIAGEHNVDLSQVEGTGLHGRITKKDVLAYLDGGRRTADGGQPSAQSLAPDEVLQPLTAMRRAIADHMTRSVRTSPHVTTIHEVDMTAVVRHREAEKEVLAARGIRLTYTAYFVAAVAAALNMQPKVNSRFTEEGIVLNRRVHIGVAVSVPDGLLVPVIRDADERNLAGLARAVSDVAERARQGRLSPEELRDGTFTITNHSMGGSLLATPIINQPQAGILGIGAIVKRPVVRSSHSLLPSADDAIVIRPMCYLSFSFDHRILDGAEADEFVTNVKNVLEKWGSGTVMSKE